MQVIICTIETHRVSDDVYVQTEEANRVQNRSDILSQWPTHTDAMVDIANLLESQDTNNLTYYTADGFHHGAPWNREFTNAVLPVAEARLAAQEQSS